MKLCSPTFSFIFLSWLLITSTLVARDSIIFNRVPAPEGIIPGRPITIMQDQQGYIWMVEYGLHRYDGYHYISYFHDPLNPNSLADNYTEAICIDHNGIIWIGTAGLDRLDPVTGIFTHYRHKTGDNTSLASDEVKAVLEDREGTIWVGTHSGLDRLNQETKTFTHYQHKNADATSLSNNQVRVLYEDSKGILWVGTGSAMVENPSKDGGLNRFDPATRTFTRYMHHPNDPQSLADNRVRAIFEDSRGIFWVGTAGDGLHTMNRQTGTFEHHYYDPAHPKKLSRSALKKDFSWVDDHITFITEDKAGAIWIGSFGNGVNRYDPKTKQNAHFPNAGHDKPGIQTSSAWSSYNSRDGVLWLGYWGNLYSVYSSQKNVAYFETGDLVEAIFADTAGTVWYGGDNTGLVRSDPGKTPVIRYKPDPDNAASISNNNATAIYQDRRGILWIGGYNYLYQFDKKRGTFSRSKFGLADSTNTSCYFTSMYEDASGTFWTGTSPGGLYKLDRDAGTFMHIPHNPKDTFSISIDDVTTIYGDRKGHLWIGTYQGGLNRMNPNTGKIQRFLPGTSILTLCEDSEGIVWAGTMSGLYRSNYSLDTFTLFTDPVANFGGNMTVNGILEDNQKTLWINSSGGICRLNRDRMEIHVYSGGPQQSFHLWSKCYKGPKGELYFGGNSGYYAFDPNEIKDNTMPPQVVINEFKVGDQVVMPGDQSVLREPLWKTRSISLRHNENTFSFGFAAIHYSRPEKNQHLFMLEGLDDEWRKAGDEKVAYYYNVPPGDYLFRVKASNGNGIWVEKKIALHISTPWWRTWWAYTLFALSFAGLIYLYIQYRINKLHMKHELVVQQHKAVELEMQALRAQMNPHFIFNCLNSINHFILRNETEAASDYLTRFSRLIRMVLHHSQQNSITLNDEIDCLEFYIEMERLRANNFFTYKINCDHTINRKEVKIPPLLLQPFVENAIWHGLMNKKENGKLEIGIERQNGSILCTIADNGIGRKKAGELNGKSNSYKKSMGIQITAKRLKMLNQETMGKIHIDIIDLEEENGEASGTKVVLKIPAEIKQAVG
jgi:ligand-binding sensor domain-containing protein